jgi:predicted membrane channel-forming protein YqfA (hemolysin III family)
LFYVFVGAASIAVFALGFFPEIYDEGLKTTRWGLLIYSLGCLAYLIKRINSKKYSAKMVFNEKG